jgi:hypothetical protein
MLPATHSYPHLPLWQHFLLRAGSFNVLALLLGPLFWFAWPKPAFLLGQCRLYGHSAESHSLRIILFIGIWLICTVFEINLLKKIESSTTSVINFVYRAFQGTPALLLCLSSYSYLQEIYLGLGIFGLGYLGYFWHKQAKVDYPFHTVSNILRNLALLCVIPTSLVWYNLIQPDFSTAKPHSYSSTGITCIKQQMHHLQHAIDLYHKDRGELPQDVSSLLKLSNQQNYPYFQASLKSKTALKIYHHKLTCYGMLGLALCFDNNESDNKEGTIHYRRLNSHKYQVYGTDFLGRVYKDRGRDFILDNAADETR